MIGFPYVPESDFEPLLDLLSVFYGDRPQLIRNLGNSFTVSGSELDIYFRVSLPLHVCIARIDVGRTRDGIGTAVFEWFKDYTAKNGAASLKIESCLTAAVRKFAKKMGMEQDKNVTDDYVINVERGESR